MDLSDLIDRNAAFTPDKIALRFGRQEWSYGSFAARITTTARALKSPLGIGRGDRVGILSTNRPDYLTLLYACARLGAMLVPLNWRLAVDEQMFILSDASVKVLVVEHALAAVMAPLSQAMPDTRVIGFDFSPPGSSSFDALLDAASGESGHPHVDFSNPLLVVYTSGTTGRPKGAVLSQQALLWNAVMSQHMHGLTAHDHVLTVLPMFHVGGLNIQTTPALQLGATVTLHQKFTPDETLQTIARERPTLTVLVPSTIQAIIEHPAWHATEVSSLRAVTTGSTQVPQTLIEAVQARGVPVLQVYGSTETCPIAVYTRLGGDLARPGSTGLPGLMCQARVVDDSDCEVAAGTAGEVLVRGPNVFSEYWGNKAATGEALRDGWYHSGDIGTRDRDGYFFIHDRKNNLIISGGENIYPAEVERVLTDHPSIAEAAVIGRPDAKWQEVPVAFVVGRPGAAIDGAVLKRHVAQHLARFKIPRDVIFVDALPRNALGKVQHFRLREQAIGMSPTAGRDTER
jgi:fatty-acyl-CoA synthase